MTQLVVARDQAGAAQHAKREGLKGKWVAVTPDSYSHVDRFAVPRMDVHWADIDWAFPMLMLDAVSACIRRTH